MPPTKKITRQMVLDAAFAVVRREGHECLNVRRVAGEMGCSTQPVMYHFKTVEELRREVYRAADEYHSRYIYPGPEAEDPLLALGLNYIRFAGEEPRLFRFLFQTDQLGGKDLASLAEDPALSPLLGLVTGETGCPAAEAGALFLALFAAAHGCASLLANNAMPFDEASCRTLLTNVYLGLVRGKGEQA